MNERSNASHKRRRNFGLRFSLRTMLLVMLIAALLCAWLLMPEREDLELAGGALRIRAQVTHPEPVPSTANSNPAGPILNGHWTLYDRDGRRLVTGCYEDDSPVGCWTYYHANGCEALSGQVVNEARHGEWTARFENARVRSETTETQIDHSGFGGIKGKGIPYWSPVRNGPARQYWETGQLRAAGEYCDDRREGDWTFFDRDGRHVAAGPYRCGLRHGTWRQWLAAEGEPQIEQYVDGHRVPEDKDRLPELTRRLLGDDVGQQIHAARQLTRLGAAAVPALKKAVAAGDTMRRLLAIRSLKQIGSGAKSAAEEVAALTEHPHPRLKCAALVALAELDPDRAQTCYAQLLQDATGDDPRLRDHAEAALVSSGPAGLKALGEALAHETPAIRYAALASIARMLRKRLDFLATSTVSGEPPTIPEIRAVLEAAQENPDEKIRDAAKWMKDMQQPGGWPGDQSFIPVVG